MANRYMTNEPRTGQAKLPPIRRKYSVSNSSMLQDFGHDNLPSTLSRLPRIESDRPLPANKTSLTLTRSEKEGNQRMLNSLITIEEQFPHLRLAATELRNPFKRSTGFEGLKGNGKTLIGSCVARGVDGVFLDGDLTENRAVKPSFEIARPLRRPVHLLRRRLRPSKAYQHSDGQITHRELLAFDQKIDQLHAFTERDKVLDVLRDFNGEEIDTSETENGDITSYIAMFEVEKRTDNSSSDATKCASVLKTSQGDAQAQESEQTKLQVHGRFYEALDLHFYHYYRNAHPERRMAICEELERSIVVDNTTLSWFRENLRLQDVLNTWML